MKVLLLVFSGTNNSLYVCTELKKEYEKHNIQTKVLKLEETEELSDDYDLIGISYPIHAFSTPRFVERKLKELNIKNKHYFIIKTSGELLPLNSASSYYIYKLMNKNNNTFLAEYHILMPYNIIFRFDDAVTSRILKANRNFIKKIAYETSNKRFRRIDFKKKYKLIRNIFKIQRLGAYLNSFLYKVNLDKCIKCMKCVNNCPTKNIKYENGKFKFGTNCLMCMRCSFFCPEDAIRIGFLNGWKVNGKYDYENLKQDNLQYENNKRDSFYYKFLPYLEEHEEPFELDYEIQKDHS
ncbi:MAG TPA: 4Fe-4S dicluster domain-containing protein [Acholeplasma sp.]|jgi:NAD-dependent dihydropyrimidine dehydrogenase PreA subunit|nr:4Fe-4S dicluster domain-containing protein [Acholeplasma sp.]